MVLQYFVLHKMNSAEYGETSGSAQYFYVKNRVIQLINIKDINIYNQVRNWVILSEYR